MRNKLKKFKKGETVKVIETGHKGKVYDYDELFDKNNVLIRLFGRHSLDLFKESELEKA